MIIDARKANKKHIVASGVGIKRTDIATPIAEINAHDAIILLIIVMMPPQDLQSFQWCGLSPKQENKIERPIQPRTSCPYTY